jgi:hypothetical protein
MKPCYYKVKTACGGHDQGDILEALVVVKERADIGMRRALVLIPGKTVCCPCLVICDQDGTHKRKPLFVETNDDAYINLTPKQAQAFDAMK